MDPQRQFKQVLAEDVQCEQGLKQELGGGFALLKKIPETFGQLQKSSVSS